MGNFFSPEVKATFLAKTLEYGSDWPEDLIFEVRPEETWPKDPEFHFPEETENASCGVAGEKTG